MALQNGGKIDLVWVEASHVWSSVWPVPPSLSSPRALSLSLSLSLSHTILCCGMFMVGRKRTCKGLRRLYPLYPPALRCTSTASVL